MGSIEVQKITLRTARIKQKLSKSYVANRLKITETELEEYERDSRWVPLDDAMALFKLYGIYSVNVFIGVDDTDVNHP